ncbi:unnamed protein product [Trichogramma brassicae]|uniref:Uncharacterized protein n=1 Tax=Trichogramma brassicae TaxID=86971 RepID=A0A6H5ID96_9HYME|nr:unnamed protein product [Trichogramma brassicae]
MEALEIFIFSTILMKKDHKKVTRRAETTAHAPSNESITAAHRHSIVHGRISRCETLTIECRYSLFPSLQSTSCSGINLGGCPFDSRHGQDRPEERIALPEPRDPQVTDLPSQAPACSSNERSTYAASSDEFVVLRQRDLPRHIYELEENLND